MDFPEAWQRWRQLEVAAEAAEARLMRQPIHHHPQVVFHCLTRTWAADIEARTVAAFLAAHVNEHQGS